MDEDILSNLGLGVDGAEPDQEDTQPQDTIDIDNTERYEYIENDLFLEEKDNSLFSLICCFMQII